MLKQNPVAEALTFVGNNDGMYTDNAPWLIPKKKASKPISRNVMFETDVFSLNTIAVIIKQAIKHIIIVLRIPILFTIHPETMLPTKPESAKIIIVIPRSSFALLLSGVTLCTHVGAHEKIAHNPISIVPKITEPATRFCL